VGEVAVIFDINANLAAETDGVENDVMGMGDVKSESGRRLRMERWFPIELSAEDEISWWDVEIHSEKCTEHSAAHDKSSSIHDKVIGIRPCLFVCGQDVSKVR
jgi:hypothetical protein